MESNDIMAVYQLVKLIPETDARNIAFKLLLTEAIKKHSKIKALEKARETKVKK